MKIAVWHNLKGGGAKRALYEQVRGLVERGHSVATWCPDTADLDYLPLTDFGPRQVVPLNLPKTRAGSGEGGLASTLARIAAMDAHCRECAEGINAGGIDVFFGYPCFMFAATPIGRHVHIPKLLYLHEPCRRFYEALPQLPWVAPSAKGAWWSPRNLKRAMENMLTVQGQRIQVREELENVRAYDRVLANSQFSRESILRAYGVESQVCYLGIDTERFRPSGAVREPFVLGMGGLFPVKRPDRTIRALATIANDARPAFVWVGHFGDGAYQQEMTRLAESLGVSFTVKIGLSEDLLVDLLGRARALVYTPQLEPFGFAPLEAGACETPVVAIAEGGIRETVVDGVNGLLVDGSEPEELGDCVARLLGDAKLRDTLGPQARDHVARTWPWDTAIDRLEKHLNAVSRA